MIERFSVSIAGATIIATLAKLALLYHTDKGAGKDWFEVSIDPIVIFYLLITIFLIFFRGKVMHDDVIFFSDLKQKENFKTDCISKRVIKFGLLLSYLSWLLWAPTIYFLDDLKRFPWFMIASLILLTISLVLELIARKAPDWRRIFWIIPNIFYGICFALIFKAEWVVYAAVGLLIVLTIDWCITDPFHGHV